MITSQNARDYRKVARSAKERNILLWLANGYTLAGIAHNFGRGSNPASIERQLAAIERRAAKAQA